MSATPIAVVQHWTRKYFRERDDVYSDIYENRQFNAIYLTMLVMAGLIALLGLLVNSPAVIIGAMLISPLMGPILSCGLALTLADWDLGKKGLRNVVFSVVEVLLITALVTALSPLKDPTPEILARSNPNLMDLLIAFFSGVAGSIALTTRSKSGLTIIPGVAIATAVMPPLATVGYGVATAQWAIARGSFMLFFTNLVAIVISADLVFFIAGFRPRHKVAQGSSPKFVRARGVIAVVILAVISIPLVRTLAQAAQQARARRQILTVLKSLEKPHDVQLGSWHFDLEPGRVVVDASITTGEPLDKDVIAQTQRMLTESLSRSAELHIRQIRVDDGEPAKAGHDFLSGGNLAATAPPPKAPEEIVADYQKRIQASLSQLAQPAGFSDVKVDEVGVRSDGSVDVHFTAKRDTPVEPDMLFVFSSALERELLHPIGMQSELLVGSTDLKFVKASRRLQRSSDVDLRKLAAIADGDNHIEEAVISFSVNSPLNQQRARTIERALKKPVTINANASSNLTDEDAVIVLRQRTSVAPRVTGDSSPPVH